MASNNRKQNIKALDKFDSEGREIITNGKRAKGNLPMSQNSLINIHVIRVPLTPAEGLQLKHKCLIEGKSMRRIVQRLIRVYISTETKGIK